MRIRVFSNLYVLRVYNWINTVNYVIWIENRVKNASELVVSTLSDSIENKTAMKLKLIKKKLSRQMTLIRLFRNNVKNEISRTASNISYYCSRYCSNEVA